MLAHMLLMKGPISSKDLGMFSTPKCSRAPAKAS